MGEETDSVAHHVAPNMLFLTAVTEFWQLLPIADNSWLKLKKQHKFLLLLGHIGSAIFHCNMGEETDSVAHHVAPNMLFLTAVTEFWQLLPIADNSWLKLKKTT